MDTSRHDAVNSGVVNVSLVRFMDAGHAQVTDLGARGVLLSVIQHQAVAGPCSRLSRRLSLFVSQSVV
jgi:hypothetical protein